METLIFEMLDKCSGSRNVPKYAADAGKFYEKADEFVKLFSAVIGDIISYKQLGGEFALNNRHVSDIIKLSGQFSVTALTLLQDNAIICLQKINYNGNRSAILDNLAFYVAEVKSKGK